MRALNLLKLSEISENFLGEVLPKLAWWLAKAKR